LCPSLGYDTIAALADTDPTGCDVAITRYRLALERGLRTLMSKMGVCTFSAYCGAQLFESWAGRVAVDRFFPGTASPIRRRHPGGYRGDGCSRGTQRAFAATAPAAEYPGLHGSAAAASITRPPMIGAAAEGARRGADADGRTRLRDLHSRTSTDGHRRRSATSSS